ncbi:MAG TPA: hypothetical protein VII40_19710 [Xanthobacteraceae bacterium]|jgi:hypothetical protein
MTSLTIAENARIYARQPEFDGWGARLYGLPGARQTGYLCAATDSRSKNGVVSLAYGRSKNGVALLAYAPAGPSLR